jgi:hypothetical protein
MYTSSSKKLWLSSYSKLKWEIEQETPNNSNFECNVFSHPHLSVVD